MESIKRGFSKKAGVELGFEAYNKPAKNIKNILEKKIGLNDSDHDGYFQLDEQLEDSIIRPKGVNYADGGKWLAQYPEVETDIVGLKDIDHSVFSNDGVRVLSKAEAKAVLDKLRPFVQDRINNLEHDIGRPNLHSDRKTTYKPSLFGKLLGRKPYEGYEQIKTDTPEYDEALSKLKTNYSNMLKGFIEQSNELIKNPKVKSLRFRYH